MNEKISFSLRSKDMAEKRERIENLVRLRIAGENIGWQPKTAWEKMVYEGLFYYCQSGKYEIDSDKYIDYV